MFMAGMTGRIPIFPPRFISQSKPNAPTADSGTAGARVMLDGIGGRSLLSADDTAQLHEVAPSTSDVQPIQVARTQPRETFQLRDHVVFFSANLDPAQVQSAEENLQRA